MSHRYCASRSAATQFGGIAIFVSFLGKIGFVEVIRKYMPIRWKSANHIEPSSNFTAFLIAILVGARRFAHAPVCCAGIARYSRCWAWIVFNDDTIRNLFRAFVMSEVQRLYEPIGLRESQGSHKTQSTTLKAAVFAPTHNAMTVTAAIVKPRVLAKDRRANLTSSDI